MRFLLVSALGNIRPLVFAVPPPPLLPTCFRFFLPFILALVLPPVAAGDDPSAEHAVKM